MRSAGRGDGYRRRGTPTMIAVRQYKVQGRAGGTMGTDILKGSDARQRWLCGLLILWSVVAYARMLPSRQCALHAQLDPPPAAAYLKSAADVPISPNLFIYLQLHETRDLHDEVLSGRANACHG